MDDMLTNRHNGYFIIVRVFGETYYAFIKFVFVVKLGVSSTFAFLEYRRYVLSFHFDVLLNDLTLG